ncbi:Plant regulator RWP-RK [Quillaja saponaria]|uniref:Plant regulator RWP-RK n=1 Tax=Quillaja saponaria TaxID=32244 RepID=A0AAD7LXZ0_QUISA|nr:Plant regulator RWP-RK [Quillaja saponaria]
MVKYCCFFNKEMGRSGTTLVCVKHVKQEIEDEWDESMPLPGDIIEGFAEEDADDLFVPAKAKSELSSQLGKINQQEETIWVKVRRGDSKLKLRARVVQEKRSMLNRKYTIQAATDDRHVAVLGDLTLEQCTELQEMSKRVVNVQYSGFNKKGMKYDWKMKVATYLPDQCSTVISSILFMPLTSEHNIEATTTRCMAWFTAALSSGAPLVFVNIQTEQIISSEKANFTRREISWAQLQNNPTTIQIVQGIRLWFLPGLEEVSLELIPRPREVRFGMDIKRTEEGFICIYSVTTSSAADRSGLLELYEESIESGFLLVISRIEGKSLMPSSVSYDGLINCSDYNEIKDTLTSAIEQRETIQLHIMAWPNQTRSLSSQIFGSAALRPPTGLYPNGSF